MDDTFLSFAEQVGKDVARMQPLIAPELSTLDHTMTGTGASNPNAWVSFNPGPPGWATYNTVPAGEYVFMLSTDSPDADFTLTFRSGGSSSPVVLTRTGDRNNPVTVRVSNPGVESYSVQHNSPGATLTMRVIDMKDSSTPQVDTSVGTRVFVGDTMVYGDTGWRDITNELTASVKSGKVFIKRLNDTVHVAIDALLLDETGTKMIYRFDPPFRPDHKKAGAWYIDESSILSEGSFQISNMGYFPLYVVDPDTAMTANFSFLTGRGWPTSLPGTPA